MKILMPILNYEFGRYALGAPEVEKETKFMRLLPNYMIGKARETNQTTHMFKSTMDESLSLKECHSMTIIVRYIKNKDNKEEMITKMCS